MRDVKKAIRALERMHEGLAFASRSVPLSPAGRLAGYLGERIAAHDVQRGAKRNPTWLPFVGQRVRAAVNTTFYPAGKRPVRIRVGDGGKIVGLAGRIGADGSFLAKVKLDAGPTVLLDWLQVEREPTR